MMTPSDLLQLLEVPLFKGLDPVKVRKATAPLQVDKQNWDAGNLVFTRGEPCQRLYLITEGRLSAQMGYADGKILRVEYLRAPEAVAALIPFSSENTFPVTLWAETTVTMLSLSMPDLHRLFRDLPELALRLLKEGGDKINFLGEKLRLTHHQSLRAKLAAHLLGFSERKNADAFRLGYTKTDLAELLGVTRPALSRCFSAMAKEGYFHEESGQIVLDGKEKLLELL